MEKTVFLQCEVDLGTLWQIIEFRTQERMYLSRIVKLAQGTTTSTKIWIGWLS